MIERIIRQKKKYHIKALATNALGEQYYEYMFDDFDWCNNKDCEKRLQDALEIWEKGNHCIYGRPAEKPELEIYWQTIEKFCYESRYDEEDLKL